MSETIAENITWNPALEKYFADTGEKAHCLSWLHKRSEAVYSYRKTWIDLPVIVISGVTGFLSAGSTSLFDNPQMSSVALGVASLFVSILNTTGSYFGWAKRAEGHRISAIHYSKLYRFLSIEMALPRDERMTPVDLLKLTRDTYDRLQEISPMIPADVISEFRKKFKNEKEISKPEEANGLEHIVVFKTDSPVEYFVENISKNGRGDIQQEKSVADPLRKEGDVPHLRGTLQEGREDTRVGEGQTSTSREERPDEEEYEKYA